MVLLYVKVNLRAMRRKNKMEKSERDADGKENIFVLKKAITV